ncbi:MAG: glycosyltransferase [Ardenticatenaceae bacterium]
MPVQVIPYPPTEMPPMSWNEGQVLLSGKRPNPLLSMVVPTRNEAGNIKALLSRLRLVAAIFPMEVVFVDDSDDDTPQVIQQVGRHMPYDVRLVHRPAGLRAGGLGSAVLTGFRNGRGPWMGVMDGDLQHPPELIPSLLKQAKQTNSDLVIASRLSEGGDASSLGLFRETVSHSLTNIARLMFPGSLGQVSDPLTGFFMLRRNTIDIDSLNPNGFKILLEILVRFPELRVTEVPFEFGERQSGDSKASWQEVQRYFKLLSELRFGGNLERFIKFGAVGASGIAVNLGMHALSTDMFGLDYMTGAVVATQGSSLWNYLLTESLVFGDRKQENSFMTRMGQFFLINNAALLLRAPMIYGLTESLGVHPLMSNFISIVASMFIRYGVSERWIWNSKNKNKNKIHVAPSVLTLQKEKKIMAEFNYNIHDIITITSDAWLPELEGFLIDQKLSEPTIRVRIDKVPRNSHDANDKNQIFYRELFGRLGFEAVIKKGSTIEIIASDPLKDSTHVLYTNLVEPILRWTFVEKGYALIHGACLAIEDEAYLVTARTDTGKTTTILRILDRQRRDHDRVSFLSDDFTLVSPEGDVMTYPKPLTVSAHTVQAVNTPLLSFRERLSLPLQSRLHSRNGRRFALMMARTPMPMATINMMVQRLVPPPKYQVKRLVPATKMTRKAQLSGVFIIERGGTGDVKLSERETIETVLENCEDAYGFPPYEQIASFLYGSNGRDLRKVERQIIAQAIEGLSATLLRSENYDWGERIVKKLEISTTLGNSERQPQPQLAGVPA